LSFFKNPQPVVSNTFGLAIANTNDAPIVQNAIAPQTVSENTAFSLTFPEDTFQDVDVGDTLTYTATLADNNPLPLWLNFNGDTRTLSGTPSQADVGSLNLKITATDKAGAFAKNHFTLEVLNTNDPPLATNDTATTARGTPVTIAVLANDSDPDGDPFYLASFNSTSAQNGTVIRDENGTPGNQTDDKLIYTPATGFTGIDSFTYTISDGTGTSTGIVSITVTSVVNTFLGTRGRDILTGTDLDDIFIGGFGADILTGKQGKDQFVYKNIRDAGDIIKDFEIGSDKIVISDLLDSFGYGGSDPIAAGYLNFGSRGSDAVILIDEDGLSGAKRALPFITVEGLGVGTAFDAMKAPSNFIF
jgi:hypothetical protein